MPGDLNPLQKYQAASGQNRTMGARQPKKALRMNSASQYVYDDLPEGVEDKIEKYITKQSAVGVQKDFDHKKQMFMAGLKIDFKKVHDQIDANYVSQGFKKVEENEYRN